MIDTITPLLRKLRLSGLGSSLEIRLHEASSRNLTHREFLELVLLVAYSRLENVNAP